MAAMAGWKRWLLVLGFAATAAFRVHLCLRPPAETTDVLRHLEYGRAFWSHGLGVFDLTPVDLARPGTWDVLWATHGYDYPIVPLVFYALLARLGAGVVAAKLVLSAIELASSLLVRRLTGSWTLGLAYFASPVSLWWVSREGQFEPLVVLLTLLAIDALRGGSVVASWAWLAFAIQAKLLR